MWVGVSVGTGCVLSGDECPRHGDTPADERTDGPSAAFTGPIGREGVVGGGVGREGRGLGGKGQ